MMDISRNSRLLCEIIKRFWFYGEKKKRYRFFFSLVCLTERQKQRKLQKDIKAMDASWIS